MNLIFLITGNARNSPFNIDISKRNMDILNSYDKYIFTDKFKSLYKYKIYISTDDIDISETINYFSKENIGNIHLLNNDYYLNPILNKTDKIEKYIDAYHNKEWHNYVKFESSIHQHYKLLDCYNLLKNDSNEFENCDYIIRLRTDSIIMGDIFDILLLFEENKELEIVMHWDFFALGKPKIMNCYFTGLDNNYGNYKNEVSVPDILPIMQNYKNLQFHWMYAPERQLFEMLFEYCNINNLDINKTIYEKINYVYIIHIHKQN